MVERRTALAPATVPGAEEQVLLTARQLHRIRRTGFVEAGGHRATLESFLFVSSVRLQADLRKVRLKPDTTSGGRELYAAFRYVVSGFGRTVASFQLAVELDVDALQCAGGILRSAPPADVVTKLRP